MRGCLPPPCGAHVFGIQVIFDGYRQSVQDALEVPLLRQCVQFFSLSEGTFCCHRDIRVDVISPVKPLKPLKVKLHKLFRLDLLFRTHGSHLDREETSPVRLSSALLPTNVHSPTQLPRGQPSYTRCQNVLRSIPFSSCFIVFPLFGGRRGCP